MIKTCEHCQYSAESWTGKWFCNIDDEEWNEHETSRGGCCDLFTLCGLEELEDDDDYC